MKDLLLLVAGAVIMWMWLHSGGALPTSLVPSQLMQMAMPQPGSTTVLDAPQAAPQSPPVIRAWSTPVVAPTPDQALGKAGGYFVINGYRLYCDLITPDLRYTGDEIMQEWWNSLSDDMKRIQEGAC